MLRKTSVFERFAPTFQAISALAFCGACSMQDVDGWSLGERRMLLDDAATAVKRPVEPTEYEVVVPVGVQRRTIAISTFDSVSLGAGAVVMPSEKPSAFGNDAIVASAGQISLGPNARVETLYALGDAPQLADGASIATFARTVSTSSSGPFALGGRSISAHSRAVEVFAWKGNDAHQSDQAVRTINGRERLEAGTHGSVHVLEHGRLRLLPGHHVFAELSVAEGGIVELENAARAVYLWVQHRLVIDGAIQDDVPNGAVLIGYSGATSLDVNWPLVGTLVAPRSEVVLRNTAVRHHGAVFARSAVLEPGAVLELEPFIVKDDTDKLEETCGTCAIYADRSIATCENDAAVLRETSARVDSYTAEASVGLCFAQGARVYDDCQAGMNLRPGACLRLGHGWMGAL